MKKELLLLLCVSVLLSACGGGSDGGGGDSINDEDRDLGGDNKNRSDYGLYVIEDGTDVLPLGIILSKNGVLTVGYNKHGLHLSGFSLVGTKEISINHGFF